MNTVDGFVRPYHRFLEKIINAVFSGVSEGGILSLDKDFSFKDEVKRSFGIDVKNTSTTFDHNFPNLYQKSFFVEYPDFSISGSGVEVNSKRNEEMSSVKAKGEFLERLSTFMPDTFYLQYPQKNNLESIHKTYRCRNMFSFFSYKYISSSYLYYGLSKYQKESVYEWQPTTNGCAGHFDKTSAKVSSLLELIQRDAFLSYWLTSTSPRKINVDSFINSLSFYKEEVEDLRKLLLDFKVYEIDYFFLDITSDIKVPSVCCVLVVESKTGKRVGVGASSDFNHVKAFLSSAIEALSVLNYTYKNQPFNLPEDFLPLLDKRVDRKERLHLYTTDEMFRHFAFMINGKQTVSVELWLEESIDPTFVIKDKASKKYTFMYLKQIFKKKKYDVYFFEYKNKVLKKYNYHVVRSISPSLYQLYLNESFAPKNYERLKKFSFLKNGKEDFTMNIFPHPFP